MPKRQKTVHRIYGGHLDHKVVRERIIRAFLIEEQKIVKKVRTRAEAEDRDPTSLLPSCLRSRRLSWRCARALPPQIRLFVPACCRMLQNWAC